MPRILGIGIGMNFGGAVLALYGIGTAGGTLLDTETDGLAADFTSSTEDLLIRDSGATLNYSGLPFDADGGKLTFTRASSATRTNSSGNIETVSSNVGRIDHTTAGVKKGFLVEEARTNLLTYSADFVTNWLSFPSATVTANTHVAPDGATTADTISFAADATDQRYQANLGVSTGGTYTFSVWLRSVSGTTTARLKIYDGTGGSDTFSSDLTLTTTWQRFSLTKTYNGTNIDGNNVAVNNATNATAKDVVAWGAQLEAGAFATSYIPTTAATVTRAADDCSIATSLFPYSATAGSLVAYVTPLNVAASRRALQIDDGTANERVTLGTNATPNGLFTVIDGGASQAAIATGTPAADTNLKMAASWAANDFALSVNGAAASTDVSGTLPTMTTMRLGSGPSAAEPLNGHIRQVTMVNRAFSDAELATRAT